MVGTFIVLLVLGAVGTLMVMMVKAEPRISSRNYAIQQGRVLQERITRELRLAYAVQSASGAAITFDTYLHRTSCGGSGGSATAIQCRVTYGCSGDTCSRAEGPVAGPPTKTDTLVNGISNATSVFSYQPTVTPLTDIGFVGVKLVYPADQEGEDAVTLEDGAALRNR